MYAKIELTTENARALLHADLLDRLNDDELRATLGYVENLFCDGDDNSLLSLDEIDECIDDNADDIITELGYEDEDHFDYVKSNGLTSGDCAYRKDGDWYDEDDLRDRWSEVEDACYTAMCDTPFYDFDDYVSSVFEILETP